jgi:hypothetical protein
MDECLKPRHVGVVPQHATPQCTAVDATIAPSCLREQRQQRCDRCTSWSIQLVNYLVRG